MDISIDSKVCLSNGVEMPRLGLGTYKSSPGVEARHSVAFALRQGYRKVDTAALYGNEADVGEGVRDSGLPREEVFVATKVWNDDQGFEQTLASFDRSIEQLGFDYVDLYLIHWPIKRTLEGTWRAMEQLVAEDRVRALGVCNFLPHHLDTLLALAEVRPTVDQVEFHPRLQQPELQRYLGAHDIALEAWAPIMRGRVYDVPEIVQIAGLHGKTPAQVSIRWVLQLGHVAIPKSVHDQRVLENADVFDFELTDEDMATLATLDEHVRVGPDPDHHVWEK